MAFRWRADDGPTLNAGLVGLWWTIIAKKPYILVIFQGGGSEPPVPPLDLRMTPNLEFSSYK